MKLGINALGLYPGKIGGAEQYLRNILKELESFQEIETYLFVIADAVATFQENERFHVVVVDLGYNHNVQLNGYILYYQIDVWFCPFFHMIPSNCSIPNVTTIFDIQQDYFPENFDPHVLEERRRLTRETVSVTNKLLTISEYSKKTLVEKYHIEPEKIEVTYLDADASFNLPVDADHLEEIRSTLPEQFILFPANMWPHKNHINLIKGFGIAKEKYNLPLHLVFTGAKERESRQIEQAIEQAQIRDFVDYLGYLPQDDMRYVFKCANMLAFPSRFEGFGIPLVEAMAAEIPIICSSVSSVPEIAGDAAVIFNEMDPEDIAEAIRRVYTDEALRKDLVEKGKQRRKDFSWEKCAEQTVEYLKGMYVPRKVEKSRLSSHPKVSIITPSFNQGEYIADTIESVLNQTYDNIEYIVMDGGSTDETVEILQSYGDRIKWVSEKDGGQADAVNKGIRVATGEIIGWLNSDDTYYPDAVEKAVAALLSHPGVDMVYGEGDYIDRNGRVTGRYDTKLFDHAELANECVICQPTAFFTKEIVEKVGLLNADLQLCMDYELWMRIGREGTVMYMPERMATSRMYEENKTLSRRDEVYKECCAQLKKHYGYVPHSWIYGYADHLLSTGRGINRKACYLALFLRYNYDRPGYFRDCFKRYLQIRKMRRSPVVQTSVVSNDKYADGWISKTYKLVLECHAGEDELLVEGEHLLPFEEPFFLTVAVNGRKKDYSLAEHGPFSFILPIQAQPGDKLVVELTANQTYIPSEHGASTDNRPLSVQIGKLILRSAYKPLVSIITPSYNQGEFIRATIESVLGQDYPNMEYIVVDGGSTDQTLDILKEYEDRLTYISEPDNGQSNAINKGFRMAKGEIVAWLNSDDVYEPGCISRAVSAFAANPTAALVYGNGNLIDRDGAVIRRFEFCRDFNLWALVNVFDYIMQPATFFKASALHKLGYLNEDLGWTMDWDLWIRMGMQYDVVYVEDILACSREYEETKTSTGADKRLQEILELMKKYSGEKMPFGYEIYYCSDLLAHHLLDDARREEVTTRLAHLLTLQPTPDREGKCTTEANFLLRPKQPVVGVQVDVTEDETMQAEFYCDGKRFAKHTLRPGRQIIELPKPEGDVARRVYIRIHSQALGNIGNQCDSWVKMKLVNRPQNLV